MLNVVKSAVIIMIIVLISSCTSRLQILKNHSTYNIEQKVSYPNLTFESDTAKVLVAFKAKYNLDSIAGNGDDVSKMINLMKWVHKIVRHDGSSSSPKDKRADEMISVCQKENRGINCRMMAIVLNDAYLAMGLKSRYVTCMPNEKKFNDCHVLNMVYSNSLKKWLWMDPTFETFVTDENSNYLNFEEVRDRLIKDLPVKAAKEINWNGDKIDEEFYLKEYMAKNLFRMEYWADSFSGIENYNTKSILIELQPSTYDPDNPNNGKIRSGVKSDRLIINNPKLFWQSP